MEMLFVSQRISGPVLVTPWVVAFLDSNHLLLADPESKSSVGSGTRSWYTQAHY